MLVGIGSPSEMGILLYYADSAGRIGEPWTVPVDADSLPDVAVSDERDKEAHPGAFQFTVTTTTDKHLSHVAVA